MLKKMLAVAAICSAVTSAQETSKESFEVASIKPGDPADRRMAIQFTPGGFRGTNVTVALLIRMAYHVQDFQVAGLPDWAKTERHNVDAKTGSELFDPAKTTAEAWRNKYEERLQLSLQNLLADRLALEAHRETREMPVYDLVVARNGPKFKLSPLQEDAKAKSGRATGRGMLQGTAITAGGLAEMLSDQIGRPVIDKTGLHGQFDFKLEWTPEPGEGMAMRSMSPPPGAEPPRPEPPASDATGPTLFTAIQEQLGLKLESARGPVEVLAIDHVEKPSAN